MFLKPNSLIAAFLFTFVFLPFVVLSQARGKVLLDADTGNEVDDLYALARILLEDDLEIMGLNATHWQTSHWTLPKSMENSHRLNQMLLGELGLQLKANRGGIARMYDWGDRAQHSAAAYEIIRLAKELPEGERLTVIALGALTNVASAIYLDESIASKLTLYWFGTTYDFENGILRRHDFNSLMDPYALDVLLFSEVEMFVMPINVGAKMKFNFEKTREMISSNTIGKFLIDRWYTHLDGGRTERTLWDLALIEAYLHPEWATVTEVETSKDNGSKKLKYYSDIDKEKMSADFFEVINSFEKRP
ncbi:nucleoside hydrolase [Poritiphilus flavus]|uniref:Nucleoside hydrolase n=1 Tax=Poritiphilus flavus TaxID=2697053 RepID=A0A6L9EEN8_9FLAO|nr:nucleoside hydrolase [Poritiphilus flavus]NAS13131.1 nucleoside hydrolase [Poritiphilus flavus]